MIDLHILHHAAATRPDWYQACLDSAHAGEALGLCTVHVLDAVGERIGANRADAFQRGQQPYLACLDSDDVLIPDGIPPLLAALQARPEVCGVYSDRQQIDANSAVLVEVRDLLGHASITMTERYAHLAPENIRAAVAVLDSASRSGHAAKSQEEKKSA